MQDKAASLSQSRRITKWIIYGFILVFFILFISRLDWYDISHHLVRIGWKFWLILPVNVLAYLFATISWRLCMGTEKGNHSLKNLFIVRHIGESLAIINPTNVIAGDGAKHLLLKENCQNSDACLSSILLSRILIIMSAVLLSGISLSIMIFRRITDSIPITSMVILAGIVIVGLVLFWRLFTHKKLYLYTISRTLISPFKDKSSAVEIIHRIKHVNYEISSFRQKEKGSLILAFFFATLHWIMGAVEICLILYLLNISIGFSDGLIIEMGVALLKSAGSFIPGQLGIEEYGNKIMLVIIGLSSPVIWISVSILRRMRQVFWLAVGVLFYLLVKNR